LSETASKYYELDKIKPYRLIVINRAIKDFKKRFNLKQLPVDCVQLAIQLNKDQRANIKIKSTLELPKKVLGRTHYIRQVNLYLVSINYMQLYDSMKQRAKYPYVYSSDRMINFTLAHEFGHIFIGHAEISDCEKNDEIKAEEDLEANEFAGRLLMPKASIENCNFSTLGEVAAHYLVSEQAILKRLTHLGRHDKRQASQTVVCSNCWNKKIESHYDYCPVCGVPLTDKKGVFTMHYTDGFKTDQHSRAIPCPQCGNTHYEDDDQYCRNCGLCLINCCTNNFCDVTYINDGCARYCYHCGSQSTFLANGILIDWKPAKVALLQIQDIEEVICGLGNGPQNIDEWFCITQAIPHGSLFAHLLEGSNAKIYDQKLLIFVKDKATKARLNEEKYHAAIISYLKEWLDLVVEDVHIISFEEYLPEPEPAQYEDVPF